MSTKFSRGVSRLIYKFLTLFPIENNKVMLVSRNGEYWSCNPQALGEYLARSGRWKVSAGVYDTVHKYIGIDFHKMKSLSYFYHLATSRFYVTNERVSKTSYPFKRKGQVFIYTGHGGFGTRKIPTDTDGVDSSWQPIASYSDCMLSDSEMMTKVTIRDGFHFANPVVYTGLPREDIFLSDSEFQTVVKQKILTQLGLKIEDVHIVLYAPTFRNEPEFRSELYDLDMKKLISALEDRFGGKWVVVAHHHPALKGEYPFVYDNSTVFDGRHSDIQELLLISDVIISDFSSAGNCCCLITGKPKFQFFPDGASWKEFTLIDPKRLPFPYAETNGELCDNIRNFVPEEYAARLERFRDETVKIRYRGSACENVEKLMLSYLKS